MQKQKIILLPPTHEQTLPAFHVEGCLADAFLAFLKEKGVEAFQPPETLEKRGPDHHRTVEISVEAGTSMNLLEKLMGEFLASEAAEEPVPQQTRIV